MGTDVDAWIADAHNASMRRLVRCYEELFDDEQFEGPSEASALFCGCETCIVREVLHAAAPFLQRALRDIDDLELPDPIATRMPWQSQEASDD